jgi:predicted  nucleic acid-binding Zn-ribbon protein
VIPLATAAISLIGFYFSTNSTLLRYGEDIKSLNSKINETHSVVAAKTEDDSKARAKIRDDFLASQVKTAEGIAKLDTRLAVAETQQTTANAQLSKISDTLEKISNTFGRRGKE